MFLEFAVLIVSFYAFLGCLLNKKFNIYTTKLPYTHLIYHQPKGFLKFVIAKLLLTLQFKQKKRLHNLNCTPFSNLILPDSYSEHLERCQDLKLYGEKANDAVAFQGSDDKGNQVLIRFARRVNNLAEIWLIVKLVDNATGETVVYTHPEHPNGLLTGLVDNQWNVGGLKCECREPMRKWRISYNGFLRKGLRNDLLNVDNNLVHVKFEFYWNAISEPFNFNYEMHPNLVADALAREKWSKAFYANLEKNHEDRYEQWGQMTGSIEINSSDIRLVLKGMRDHCFGKRNWKKYARYTANMGYAEDGTFFHIGAVCMPKSTTHLTYGYVGLNDGTLMPISSTSLNLALLGDNERSPKEFTTSFRADNKTYFLRVLVENEVSVYNGFRWESRSHLRFIRFLLNDYRGTGFSEFEYKNEEKPPARIANLRNEAIPLSTYKFERFNEEERLFIVAPLSHRICLCREMVGGKALQLAQLNGLQGKFTVPTGVCITVNGFRLFLEDAKITNEIDALKKIIFENTTTAVWIKKANELKEKLLSLNPPQKIVEEVEQQLDRIYFGQNWETLPFAVRSSALDEDGSNVSFAGQLSTELNVTGKANLPTAIVKVWASTFSNECLSYRLQNGLPLISDLAVVVQQMVDADVAGVMFTCDPLTGDPGKVVINACRGLGEAIVSGSVTPDVVTVSKSYSGKIIGLINDNESLCVTKEQINQLINVGLEIERCSASPRDIEWAFQNGRLFLLQSRPITNLDPEFEYALTHEFDSSAGGLYEYSTTHNVGEVMTGVNTPLGVNVSINAIDKALQHQLYTNGLNTKVHSSFIQCFLMCANQVAIKLTQTLYKDPLAAQNRRISELCLLGKTLDDPNLDAILRLKFKNYSKLKKIFHFFRVMKMMYKACYKRDEYLNKYKNAHLTLSPERNNCSELISSIETLFPYLIDVWTIHHASSGYSGFWYHLIMEVIVKHVGNLTPTNYIDIAMLYSSCTDVESADIPAALQKLSKEIASEIDPKVFADMSVEKAHEWLVSAETKQSKETFKNFIRIHGHRCLKEIDLQAKAWNEDASSLIATLQSLVAAGNFSKRNHGSSVEHALENLSVDLSYFEKIFLLWAVKRARGAVGNREETKSLAIKVTHALRLGYRKLAKDLVCSGILPDKDLVYYFTHYELRQLVYGQKSSTSLISRAQKRRKIRKVQEKISLPEVIIGHPMVIPEDEYANLVDYSDKNVLSGTPVSAGKIKGVVRVCATLDEAKNIQPNEILVTYSTDIAWSVYFPIISGIITELGGLLSHGAVVAREFGIPCLVSANNATKILKTGKVQKFYCVCTLLDSTKCLRFFTNLNYLGR